MTGEPTHTTSEMTPHAPAMLIIVCKVKYPLCFIVSYVQPITQHFESKTIRKVPLQSPHTERNGVVHPGYNNYRLKSEISIMLRCCLCSTHYTAVRIKNCSKSTSTITRTYYNKITAIKNTDDFHYEGKPSCANAKSTLFICQQR